MFTYAMVFFFKQKTAYEMRISDWSSDVCSSDLRVHFPPAQRSLRGPATRSIEIFLYPGMIGRQQFVDRSHGNHSLVGNHGDPVANCIKRVQIMRDEEYGKTQRALQFFRLVIESSSANRIQPRRRLVQKQEIRIKR